LEIDTFWRPFLLNDTTCFVQNDIVSLTVHFKKKQNCVVLTALCILFFPWTRYRQGKKVFSPLQHLSLSLAPPCSRNPKTNKTNTLTYHQTKKQNGPTLRAATLRLHHEGIGVG
jgi:hypothetical protein